MEIIVVSSPDPADTPLGQSPVISAGPGPEPDGAAIEREHLDRLAESAVTNARINTLEEALEAATSRAESLRRGRRRWLGTIALLIVVGAILQALLTDRSARRIAAGSNPSDSHKSESPKPHPPSDTESPLRRLARLPSRAESESRAIPPPSGEVALAAEKLGTALSMHPEQSWPQILNRIRQTSGPAVCPFVWIDGAIAFILPEAPAGIGSLPAVLARCAEAVNGSR